MGWEGVLEEERGVLIWVGGVRLERVLERVLVDSPEGTPASRAPPPWPAEGC